MDLVGKCKEKLAYFRIKELKDVLTQLNLAKQGKKQDLMDRILALLLDDQVPKSQLWGKRNSLGKEEVAKIIEDTYRKMQAPSAMDLASRSHSGSDFNVIPKEEVVDSLEMKVRCPCGTSLMTESMIQCEDCRCRVWQHIGCVILPDKPSDGASPELPSQFYCELCRITRADPFWQTIGHPLLPIMLAPSVVAVDGTSTIRNEDRTFQLSRADREMLQKTEYDLQAWCLLLNDKVQFRMQWPQHVEFQVNGFGVRVVTRPGSQLLGINGRDDGAMITTYSREGINKICLSRSDARVFCFGIRLAKRRTVQQVLNLVPKEPDGESFEDALARVRRCVGGGAPLENADSDSDIEVVADSITVNLRCPMSGSRIKIAGRFKPCVHMGCFDLETFVELNQRSRKWQCPICLKNYSLENIIIDPYFNRITSMLHNCGEDINEIDVKPDGSWRAKNENEVRDLAKWHLPDGSLCPAMEAEVKPNSEKLREIKQETASEHKGLKLGIKRNHNGVWEVSKSSGSPVLKFENDCQNILPMSSSATGSCRDGEDPSVDQDVAGNFDLPLNNGHELDSLSLNFDTIYNVNDRMSPPPLNNRDVVIVLSDSDEDNVPNTYETRPANSNGVNFLSDPGVSERYPEGPDMGTNGTSCLGLFNNTTDVYGMPIWPMQTCTQTGPGFQLFGEEADGQDALIDSQSSLGCPPNNGYVMTTNDGLGDNSHVQDLSTCHPNAEMNGSLVDNPLAYSSEDPSLQIFLPSRPAGVPLHSDLSDRAEATNLIHSDDWISLSLAAGEDPNKSVPAVEYNSKQQFSSRETRIEPLDDAAELLLSMNDNRSNTANLNTERSDNSLAHTQQARSVRPRLFLSIDSDSD